MWETVSARKDLLALLKDVLRRERCAMNTLKRDTNYNIPQPGRAGRKYDGLMYVGQNPGEGETPPRQSDAAYLDALREVTDLDSLNFMRDQLKAATGTFAYYSSFHFDVDIERVAYVNAVRCRTHGNAKPNEAVRQNCRRHFLNRVRCLEPRGVV